MQKQTALELFSSCHHLYVFCAVSSGNFSAVSSQHIDFLSPLEAVVLPQSCWMIVPGIFNQRMAH